MAWQHSLPPEPNDFFAIGGDSLTGIQLVTQVRDHPAVSARCIAFTHFRHSGAVGHKYRGANPAWHGKS